MFWNLVEICLLMIDIFLLENNLIKFNRKKSIQQNIPYQKISYYLNRIMSKENFAERIYQNIGDVSIALASMKMIVCGSAKKALKMGSPTWIFFKS